MKKLTTITDYIVHFRFCGLKPNNSYSSWIMPNYEYDYNINLFEDDDRFECVIRFQYDESGRFTKQISNATLEDISSVITLYKRAETI